MTALYIIGGIFLLIFGFLMLRAEVIIIYAEEFGLAVRVCGITVRIMPRKPKKVRPGDYTSKKIAQREAKAKKKAEKAAAKKKEKKVRKEADKAKKAELKKQGKLKKKPLGDIISLILALVKTAVSRFAKHLRVRVARLHISVATGDAAKTAITYGMISQSASYIAALLDSTGTLRYPARSDVDIHADYLSEKTAADIEIGFSLCVWQLFDILIRTGITFIKQETKK